MRKLLAILTLAFTLTGCGTIAGIDATTVLGPTVFKNAVKTDDRVTVADFRTHNVEEAVVENTKSGTIIAQSEFKDDSHNWNKISTASTVAATDRPTVAQQQPQQTKEQIQHDKSMTLTWFFFSMMLMGMLGAGIIGLIEAVSGRNSLDTTPSAPPPRFKPHNNNNNQQNKKGK